MPYPTPTLAELNARVLGAMKARLEGSDPQLRVSFENIFGLVISGAVEGVHKHLQYISLQVFPDTADEEGLLKWGAIWGVPRLEAQRSTSVTVSGTGAAATLLPEGTELENTDGGLYVTTADNTSDGGGLFTDIPVEASELGADFNLAPFAPMALVSGTPGVDSDFSAGSAGLDGGLDLETVEAYRVRILARISTIPESGKAGDYVVWAKEIAGVTRAFEQNGFFGFGTVRLLFARDDDLTPVPNAAEILEVQNYLQEVNAQDEVVGGQAPLAIPVIVQGIAQAFQSYTVQVNRDTNVTVAELQANIETSLNDLHFSSSKPDGTLFLSQINAAIAAAPGVTFHILDSPLADVVTDTNSIVFLDTLTVIDIP